MRTNSEVQRRGPISEDAIADAEDAVVTNAMVTHTKCYVFNVFQGTRVGSNVSIFPTFELESQIAGEFYQFVTPLQG